MNNEKPVSKTKEIFNTILGIIIFIGIIFYVYDRYFANNKDKSLKNLSLNEELMKVVNEYNKMAPFMIDANTQFDNMTLLPGNEVRYSFTAVNMTKDEVDVDEFKNDLTELFINQIKTNPDLSNFKKLKVTVSYSYKDMGGVHICSIKITPDMYQ